MPFNWMEVVSIAVIGIAFTILYKDPQFIWIVAIFGGMMKILTKNE